jgi:hypothetical protein
MFGGDSQEALGWFIGTSRLVFDSPERVEGVGEGDAQSALDQQPRPTRQPIMGMKDLRGVGLEHLFHLTGKQPHMLGKSRHGERGRRSCVDVEHAVTGDDIDNVRIVGVDPAGIDIGPDAAGRHGPGELVEVDVHASGVT